MKIATTWNNLAFDFKFINAFSNYHSSFYSKLLLSGCYIVNLSIAKAIFSCLSNLSIKFSSYQADPQLHPFLWCILMSVLSQKHLAYPSLRVKQTCKSRKGKNYPSFRKNPITFPNKNSLRTQSLFFLKSIIASVPTQMNKSDSKISWSVYFGTRIRFESMNNYKVLASWDERILLKRAGDVESNPGPVEMTLITQNCRGLKKDTKLRQLLNKINRSHNNVNTLIVALQETHIESSNLKYMWSGSHIITPGTGHQGGCITLLSNNISVIKHSDIGNEGHVALIEKLGRRSTESYIIVNLHAPCTHNNDKLEFFKTISQKIDDFHLELDCEIVIMGDFNTVFHSNERLNTKFTNSERKYGSLIKTVFERLQLTDCWSNNCKVMTWKHGDKMSKIDRIMWTPGISADKITTVTDWTYTESDHAAVISTFITFENCKKERITHLDTRFMSDVKLKHLFLTEVKNRVEQIQETNMNLHQQLEYLKMSIRSIVLEIASNVRKESIKAEEGLKKEINFWQKTFENATSQGYRDLAISNLDELMAQRNKFLDDRGEYLSRRVKTKWYHESEKSTKYFLNMQRAKTRKTEMDTLIIDGMETSDALIINKEVEYFYKKLYEKGNVNSSRTNSDFFLDKISKIDNPLVKKLDSPLTKNDLLNTLNTCADLAPGPDGIPYSIIKLAWNYFGDLLLNSWNYAQEINELTHSHEESFLRLIPKDGKDPKILKNWRPITLSNCDFKIITKALSKRLTATIEKKICLNQTAYIPGRQITDNLHILQYAIQRSNQANISSSIVSLDAEKAFDSVEHNYIKKVLTKFGLESFIKIFDLLYKDQKVNIILNGGKVGSYTIRNGVKQGDALSCILFIMSIEPLLRNILGDEEIKQVQTNDNEIPKVVAYADDIACIVNPDNKSFKRKFEQYDLLTSCSGLKLNADKTEIIGSSGLSEIEINYQGQRYILATQEIIKINGLMLSFDTDVMYNQNVSKIYQTIAKQLGSWASRGLSLLGKILIYKTFGLSQILFVASTLLLKKSDEAKITNLIYKFIWNRDMSKNKAPDRIKRETLKRPIISLGFGMIDFRDVVMSIRIKNLVKIINQPNHPQFNIIKSNINNSWLNIAATQVITPCLNASIKECNAIWHNHLTNSESHDNNLFMIMLKEYIWNIISKKYLKSKLAIKHKHDTLLEILLESTSHPILSKIDPKFRRLITLGMQQMDLTSIPITDLGYSLLPIESVLTNSCKVTSKKIRLSLKQQLTSVNTKLLSSIDISVAQSLGRKVKSISNTKLKSILLRVISGDIYCGTRLKRFGMSDNDNCPRCDAQETIEHMIFECSYVQDIWQIISETTGVKNDSIDKILGLSTFHDKSTLTINAEILRQLMAIERPLIKPLDIVSNTLKRLTIIERGISRQLIESFLQKLPAKQHSRP